MVERGTVFPSPLGGRWPGGPDEGKSPRVLVIRLSSLGDLILATPVFENLKAAGARTSVLVKAAFAPVFEGNPFVDEVLVFEERGFLGWAREIRRRLYDAVVDLHGTPRSYGWSWLSGARRALRYDKRARERRLLVLAKRESPRLSGSVVDRYLECLDVPTPHRSPKLFPRPSLPEALEKKIGPGPFVALAPGAAHATKQWPPERFAESVDKLLGLASSPLVGKGRGEGLVLILGSKSDRPAAEQVASRLGAPSLVLAGETSLPEMFTLLSRCRLALTNDSGAMHAAAALGVPTVAVFGPTVRAFGFFPQGPNTAVVQSEGLYCRPCRLHGSETCPETHFRCMRDLTSDAVVSAALKILKA
jgi:heptosyltransferase II